MSRGAAAFLPILRGECVLRRYQCSDVVIGAGGTRRSDWPKRV